MIKLKTLNQSGFCLKHNENALTLEFCVDRDKIFEIPEEAATYPAFKVLLTAMSFINNNKRVLYMQNKQGYSIRISNEDKMIIEFSDLGTLKFELGKEENYIFSEIYRLLSYEDNIIIKTSTKTRNKRKHLALLK